MSAVAALKIMELVETIKSNVSLVASDDVLFSYTGGWSTSEGVRESEGFCFSASGTVSFVLISGKSEINWNLYEDGIKVYGATTSPETSNGVDRHRFYANISAGKQYKLNVWADTDFTVTNLKNKVLICANPVVGVVRVQIN